MDAATGTKVEIGCTLNVSQSHWDSIFKPKKKSVKCYDCGSDMHEVDQDMFLDKQWKCEYCGVTRLTNEDGDES